MVRSLVSVIAFGLVISVLAPMAIGGATAQQDVTLTVTVLNHNDNPVPDAELTATWDGGSATETTRANGQTLIDVPKGADVEITIDNERYVRNRPLQVEDASTREVEMNVWLSGTATITVEDADGPVEGVRVTVRDSVPVTSVQTNADGVATTARLERGEYRVTALKEGYFRETIEVDVDREEVSDTIEIERGVVSVQFNVTDDHFEPARPIEDARIEVGGDSFTTRENGLRSTDLPVNTDYEVRVSKDGYEAVTEEVSVRESDSQVAISIQRTPELVLEVANDRVVVDESTRVTVTNEYDEPVAGATVSVDGTEAGQTDENGEAVVRIVDPGEREITAATGGLSASVTVEGVDPDAEDEETPIDTPQEPTDTPEPDEEGPGFGVVVGVLAVLALSIVAYGRSRYGE